jgi:hypothetical protein
MEICFYKNITSDTLFRVCNPLALGCCSNRKEGGKEGRRESKREGDIFQVACKMKEL